jgi:uncharacterized damage-inducible protein DinB
VHYEFLIETYATERVKVLSVWSMFRDDDLPLRPHATDPRGRSIHEHMVHQCVGEDFWFRAMLGIDLGVPPLPPQETRLEFMAKYAQASAQRLADLRSQAETWWPEIVSFFDVPRSRAWIMTRRLTHTAQHRGQLLAMLRMLNRDLHSTYGPTADTGGLMFDHAPTLYAYPDLEALFEGESHGGAKNPLPAPSGRSVTERPHEPDV